VEEKQLFRSPVDDVPFFGMLVACYGTEENTVRVSWFINGLKEGETK